MIGLGGAGSPAAGAIGLRGAAATWSPGPRGAGELEGTTRGLEGVEGAISSSSRTSATERQGKLNESQEYRNCTKGFCVVVVFRRWWRKEPELLGKVT